jgi:hypothetical protein
MFNELKGGSLGDNIILNPEILEKKRSHGSLTQGIISNMEYANTHFIFKHCIILSGRTVFYKDMSTNDLDKLIQVWNCIEERGRNIKQPFTDMSWHWPSFRKTLLAKQYLSQGYSLVGSEHEGITFTYNVVTNILRYLNNNKAIKDDLFSFNKCVEEFALQTIAMNEFDPENYENGFRLLGHGVTNDCDVTKRNKFTRKIDYYK